MDWIVKLAEKPKKSLVQQVENLQLDPQAKNKKYTTFKQSTFKSRYLPQTFKNNHFTDITAEEPDNPGAPLIDFMLLMPTQYQAIKICMTVSVDLSKQFVKYSSYPVKHSQILNFTSQQIVTLSRFFSFYLNPRLSVGWLCIDPQSGCLTYKHANNSLGFLEKRIEDKLQDLTEFLSTEVNQIEKNWRIILPEIYTLLNISERKILSHPFWYNYNSAKAKKVNHYESSKFYLLTEYVKHSFIEYPQMFDETVSGRILEVRSRFLSKEEKAKKYLQCKQKQDELDFESKPLNKEIYNVLELFYPKCTIEHETKTVKKQLDENNLVELCKILEVNKYQAKNEIYSKLEIRQVQKEEELSRSGFSQLKLLLIDGVVRQEQSNNVQKIQKIVSKETDHHRHINQCQILKYIGSGKWHFIARYFFCKEKPKQILLEYCPQKTINSYLTFNKQIVSLETKLVLLSRIALGIRFLRDYGVYHNDLKPDNVLLKVIGNSNKSYLLTRLIDFGQSYSRYQRDLLRKNWYHRGWTIPYAPPQQVMQSKESKYSQKTDVFSLGVILYQFMFGQFPAQTFRKGKQLYMKEEGYIRLCAMAPQKCRDFSCPKLMQLIYMLFLRCISPTPEHRPSIDWIYIILMEVVYMAGSISCM